MAVADNIRLIQEALKEAGRIDLYSKLLEIHEKAIEIQEENRELKEENAALKEHIRLVGQLRFTENNSYLQYDEAGVKVGGPFCTRCWDTDKKLINLHNDHHPQLICPVCKTRAGTREERP